MKVGVVDEGVASLEPAEPHRGIGPGLHERGDPPIVGRPLVLPPEFFGAVVEARRTARLLHDQPACPGEHLLDVGTAPRIEPGVVGRDVLPVGADADHPRHLTVDADGGDRIATNPPLLDALLDRVADARELPCGILLDDSRPRPRQPRRFESRGDDRAVGIEGGGLRALRADVDADQDRHVPHSLRRPPHHGCAAITTFNAWPLAAVS